MAAALFDQCLQCRAVDHVQLVEALDQRVGRRHRRAGAAHRHLVEQRLLLLERPTACIATQLANDDLLGSGLH